MEFVIIWKKDKQQADKVLKGEGDKERLFMLLLLRVFYDICAILGDITFGSCLGNLSPQAVRRACEGVVSITAGGSGARPGLWARGLQLLGLPHCLALHWAVAPTLLMLQLVFSGWVENCSSRSRAGAVG